MLGILMFFCADIPRAAKVSYLNYSHQTLMEMVVDDIHDKCIFKKRRTFKSDRFIQVCDWKGVLCEPGKNDVIAVSWFQIPFKGILHLKYLPDTLKELGATHCEISGSCNLTILKPALSKLQLGSNMLTGSIDLSQLPSAMEILSLPFNSLEGDLNIQNLPSTLRLLDLYHNSFRGNLRVSNLTPAIEIIGLQQNFFSAVVVTGKLPDSLSLIRLDQSAIALAVDDCGDPVSMDVTHKLRVF